MSSVIEEYFKVIANLPPENVRRLETVDWLLDESESVRGSGRSLLMALAFIRKGAFEPGRWIKVWDHQDPSRSQDRRNMMNRIVDMLPGLVEPGTDAIQIYKGWTPKVFDKMMGFIHDMRARNNPEDIKRVETRLHYSEVVKDVKMAATAALMPGAPPEEVLDVVREAIVQCVMES